MAYGFDENKGKVDVYTKAEVDAEITVQSLQVAKWHIDPSIVPCVIRADASIAPIKFLPDESLEGKEIVELLYAKALGLMNRSNVDKYTNIEIMTLRIHDDNSISAYAVNNTAYDITITDSSSSETGTYILGLVRQL